MADSNLLQLAVFSVIVFGLYLALRHKWQNRLLLIASCLFYASWDWRFLGLVFISISTDYLCALKIHGADDGRTSKHFLILSLLVNLLILGFFKYFNFFVGSFQYLLNQIGISADGYLLNIALPVGISFYTFKTISYTIDVYTGRIEPERNYFDYALFVIFFPLLLAGPIMRAPDLMPQITSPRKLSLEKFYESCHLIFWGMFQKIFIADNLGRIADTLSSAAEPSSGASVLLSVYAFAFQIYYDFAGYSNMARGVGKCMGFEIMVNFNLPYFATNPQDFWSRWHISLSTWLRDYIYTPIVLGKRHWAQWGAAFATMVTFILCGLWHGAAWTFIVWGTYWGLVLVTYSILKPLFKRDQWVRGTFLNRSWFCVKRAFFFHVICFGWLIFKARSLDHVKHMVHDLIFNFSVSSEINLWPTSLEMIFFALPLFIMDTLFFIKKDQIVFYKSSWPVKVTIYVIGYYLMILYGGGGGKDFLYIQF